MKTRTKRALEIKPTEAENKSMQAVLDPVNPAHYKGDYVMRVIEDFELDFCLGNVVKYICRHGQKAGLVDLKKAKWYLERAIGNMEKKA